MKKDQLIELDKEIYELKSKKFELEKEILELEDHILALEEEKIYVATGVRMAESEDGCKGHCRGKDSS